MGLKAIVEKLEDVPEAHRELYVERDGKFHLDAEGFEDVTGLKSALEKERAERRTAKDKLKELEGVDAEEYKRLKDEAQEREHSQLKAEGKFEELRLKWEQQKTKELTDRDVKIKELESGLRKFKLDDKVRAAALEAGVLPDDIDDVMTITRGRFDLGDKDRVLVLDGDNDPIDITADQYFKTVFKESKPKFYAPSGASGSGASNATSGTANGVRAVSISDQQALNANLEKIASGEIAVR